MSPAPVILVAGTWAHAADWWRPTSAFAELCRLAGLTVLGTGDQDPYSWTTELDGLSGDDVDWDEAGKALVWYAHLKHPPVAGTTDWQPVSVIAHSHGAQVVAKAARHGLCLDRVVTVASPPRASLDADYLALQQRTGRWTHIWTNEPYWGGWQRRGQFEWSWTGLKRGLWPIAGEMARAHVNLFEPDATHAGLLDVALWRARGWAALLGP